MRDFDPDSRPMVSDTTSGATVKRGRRSGLGWLGALAVIAIMLGLGLLAWRATGDSAPVAGRSAPGTTTGSSGSGPSAPALPNAGPTNTR